MRWNLVFVAATSLLALLSSVNGQGAPDPVSDDGLWTALAVMPEGPQKAEPWIRPDRFQAVKADMDTLRAFLRQAPMEGSVEAAVPLLMSLPMADGGFAWFHVVESPVMAPQLAAKFPEVKTYLGQGVDDPAATVRFDDTPQGFHCQLLSPHGNQYIDPYSRGDSTFYACYFVGDLTRFMDWECHTPSGNGGPAENPYAARTTGSTLRTFSIAIAATGGYTSFHGGSVALGQAAIVTAVNRINQIFENEFAVRLVLVANNSNLVYTNAATDPYTDGNLPVMIDQNQANIDAVIGTANYDVGHVFSAQNIGGLAQRPAICDSGGKARGGTGVSPPNGDFFYVQYVSHELGHQFGADHSFNADDTASGGQCLSNRSASWAYEPGSGATIMSYFGICGSNNNLAGPHTATFNQGAYQQVAAQIGGALCDTETATGNTAPTVSAGNDATIPKGTAFELTATGSDANGDTLSYSWEERDLGVAQPASGAGSADNGDSPIFRVFTPVSSPTRVFPRLADVVDGSVTMGEQYPQLARSPMVLRVTARDNRAGGGGVNFDDINITINGVAGPFVVTSPNTGVSWSGTQTVTWNVASTNVAPVNSFNVEITLSTDGGVTFPTVLLASTPNDGSQDVVLPVVSTSTARIKVKGLTNKYFFDVSNTNFTITAPPPPSTPTGGQASPATVCVGSSTNLSANVGVGEVVDWYTGSCGGTFVGTGSPLAVSPTVNTNYRARARNTSTGQVSASCALVAALVAQPPAFTLQPANAAVNDGDPAAFSVTVSGSGPFTYQWRKGVTNLVNGGNISGASTASLSINPAGTSDAGDYNVVVSTPSCGSITSNNGTLTVQSTCGSPDFDGDGDSGTDLDIEAFFACLGGDCCATCGSPDFDGDGDSGTDLDIEAFFRVLGGGDC